MLFYIYLFKVISEEVIKLKETKIKKASQSAKIKIDKELLEKIMLDQKEEVNVVAEASNREENQLNNSDFVKKMPVIKLNENLSKDNIELENLLSINNQ